MNNVMRATSKELILPGAFPPAPGEPEANPRLLNAPIPLDAFRLVHSDRLSWHRDSALRFTIALLLASGQRRINAGHKGLMVEAARMVLRAFLPEVRRIYRERGFVLNLSDAMLDGPAREYAAEMRSDAELKREVERMLDIHRAMIATDANISNNSNTFAYICAHDTPVGTMNRWLDFIEHIKEVRQYSNLVYIQRLLVYCLRVRNAVFDDRY